MTYPTSTGFIATGMDWLGQVRQLAPMEQMKAFTTKTFLQKVVFPSPHLALTLAHRKIYKLVHILLEGQLPNQKIRNDISHVLKAYLDTPEASKEVKESQDLRKFIGILSDPNASVADKTAHDVVVLSYQIIEKEFTDKSGAIARASRIFFDQLNSSLGLTGMDAYEPGRRATLLSDPALDTAYQAISQLLRNPELELPFSVRQQMSKDLRELAPHLSADKNKVSVLEFCDLLDDGQKTLTQQDIKTVNQIINEETEAREKFKKLNPLYRSVHRLYENIKNYQQADLKDRKVLAETLREFAGLSTDETKRSILQLCSMLENKEEKLNTPQNKTLIKTVYSLLKQEHDHQTGPLEKAIEVIITKVHRYFAGVSAQFHPSESKSKIEYYRNLFKSKESPQKPETPVVDVLGETKKQISLLKTNISRMALGHMACYLSKISTKDKEGDWIIRHMSSSDEHFINAINRHIEDANIPWLRQQIVKLTCKVLEPLLSYYIDHFITHITQEITNWINLPPSRQLETIVQTLIDPLSDYLTTLIKIHVDLSKTLDTAPPQGRASQLIWGSLDKEPVTRQIPTYFEEEVTKLQKNDQLDLSLRRLTDKLIDNILKYSPRFNWAEEASQHFKEKAQLESIYFNKLWKSECSRFFYSLSYLTSFTQWVVDTTIHFIFKKSLRMIFHAFFSSPEKKRNYIYSINSFLRKNLEKINKESDLLKTTPLADHESPHEIPKKIEIKIFNILELTRQAVAQQSKFTDATAFFKRQESLIANLKDDARREILSLAKPIILKQIIPLLQTITSPDLLKNGWLNSLKKINELGFHPTSAEPLEPLGDPIQVEHAMRSELEIFLQKKIGKAIDDLHDPQESLQRIVTSYFNTSNKKLTKMDIEKLPIENILSTWKNIISWRENRTTHFETLLSRDILDPIYEFNTEFILKSKKFENLINTLSTITKEQLENKTTLDKFSTILENLNKEPSQLPYNSYLNNLKLPTTTEITKTIKILIASKSSEQNEAIIAHLKKLIQSHIDTELKTKQIHLNQTIVDLKVTVNAEFLKLSKWVAEQKPPEVSAQPSLILRLFSPLLVNPTINSSLITIAKNNSDAFFEFLDQGYHFPIILQFILRGYLKKV